MQKGQLEVEYKDCPHILPDGANGMHVLTLEMIKYLELLLLFQGTEQIGQCFWVLM